MWPLAVAVTLVALAGHGLDLPIPVAALLALGATILGNRAFHLDGLSDTVDGMAASYDRELAFTIVEQRELHAFDAFAAVAPAEERHAQVASPARFDGVADRFAQRVHPTLVPKTSPIADVESWNRARVVLLLGDHQRDR